MSAESPQGRPIGPQVLQQVNQQQAVADATQTQQVRSLATLLAPSGLPQMTVLKAVVTATNFTTTPRTFSANIGGDNSTVVDGIRFIDTYVPVVGDTCLLVKIGADVFGLGQLNNGGTPAQNGWVAPTPASGCASDSFDPLLYRIIYDHGDPKIQLRGKLNLTGTPTLLWTMPTGLRPLFNKTPLLLARGYGGGSVAAQLQVNADGTMVLVGNTFTVGTSSGTTGSTNPGGGTTGTTSVQHYHLGYDASGNFLHNTSGVVSSGGTGGQVDGGEPHSHSVPSLNHSHSFSGSVSVTGADWISFNGVEYFL